MIRVATHDDLPRLIEMGRKFHEAGMPHAPYDPDSVAGFLSNLIDADHGVVFVSERGMIGGMLGPAYTAPNYLMAIELFWWAEDRQGMRLLRRFEQWAKDIGADEVRMTTMSTLPNAARLLRGYAPIEISYRKAI